MFITLKRIVKSGFKTFLRNGFLAASSVLVITIALLTVLFSFTATVLLESGVNQLENKVDVNIYFKPDASLEDVLELKKMIVNLPSVNKDKTNYMTKDDVLQEFKKRNKDNEEIKQALEFVDGNPFGEIMNIKTDSISGYKKIDSFIKSDDVFAKFGNIIEFSNFEKNQKAISKLNLIVLYIKQIGWVLSLILIGVSVIVTFNTMRLIIYSYKEEISVMRLVGASKFFARGPFIVEGMIYGVISAVFALFIYWSVIRYITPIIEPFFLLDLNQYVSLHILYIIDSLFAGGVMLGFVSTYIAVSKYLKV